MKPFRIRDSDQQTLTFYRGYDPYFIRAKAQALVLATENWAQFSSLGEGQGISALESERERQALRAHIRFSEYHQFEASFALALAELQEQPHWLFLTTYQTGDLLEVAKALSEGDVSKVTGGKATDRESFVRRAIYSGVSFDDPAVSAKLNASIEHVAWMLGRAAGRYVKAASRGGEYNAYKHGARVLVGSSAVYVSTSPTPTDNDLLHATPDSLMMLELERKADSIDVFQLVRHFNPAESYCYIDFMSRISENMRNIRLARIDGGSPFKVHVFSGRDRETVLALGTRFEYRVTS